MSHPPRVHGQFWKSMSERFGVRWFEVHGKLPSKAWTDLLNQFEIEDIEAAQLRLKDRPERERAHPPTHAEFQVLLAAAAKRRAVESESTVRDRWRSIVISTCLRHAALLNLVPYGETKLDRLPDTVYRIALGVCNELLVWACEDEARTGERNPAVEQHINSTLWNLLKPWARQGEFDTGHLSASSVPRETQHNREGAT